MKKINTIIVRALLLFIGMGAIYGGLNLIIHPDGSSLHLDTTLLLYTPFTDYLIPGILLFIANGILSTIVFIATFMRTKYVEPLILAQGIILSLWIIAQVIMIQVISIFHIILLIAGIMLIVSGRAAQRNKDRYRNFEF